MLQSFWSYVGVVHTVLWPDVGIMHGHFHPMYAHFIDLLTQCRRLFVLTVFVA